MAEPSVVIPLSFTADCLLPCCLPANCRCGSNFAHDLGCPLPAPPAVYGRDMPAVLYGQVTGYRTLRVCYQQQVGDPSGTCTSPRQVGGCFEYLSQVVNWPFRLMTVGGFTGYFGDGLLFPGLFGGADCTFAGFDPAHPGLDLRFRCGGEMRCTFAAVGVGAFQSCGPLSFGAPNCAVSTSPFVRFPPSRIRVDANPAPGDPPSTFHRSGVVSCDPFWGRIEFFDDADFPGSPGATCDQSGHPEPPCCVNPATGLKGPCGLASLPPLVPAYAAGPGGCCDFTPARAPLAVRVDLFETPV